MPLRISKSYREAILHFLRTGKPRFQRLLHGSRRERKLARELLSKEKRRADWDVLRRVTKPISDDALQAYLKERWPHIYKEQLLTLLLDHGSDAYNKLVRGAKIGPLF